MVYRVETEGLTRRQEGVGLTHDPLDPDGIHLRETLDVTNRQVVLFIQFLDKPVAKVFASSGCHETERKTVPTGAFSNLSVKSMSGLSCMAASYSAIIRIGAC